MSIFKNFSNRYFFPLKNPLNPNFFRFLSFDLEAFSLKIYLRRTIKKAALSIFMMQIKQKKYNFAWDIPLRHKAIARIISDVTITTWFMIYYLWAFIPNKNWLKVNNLFIFFSWESLHIIFMYEHISILSLV